MCHLETKTPSSHFRPSLALNHTCIRLNQNHTVPLSKAFFFFSSQSLNYLLPVCRSPQAQREAPNIYSHMRLICPPCLHSAESFDIVLRGNGFALGRSHEGVVCSFIVDQQTFSKFTTRRQEPQSAQLWTQHDLLVIPPQTRLLWLKVFLTFFLSSGIFHFFCKLAHWEICCCSVSEGKTFFKLLKLKKKNKQIVQ